MIDLLIYERLIKKYHKHAHTVVRNYISVFEKHFIGVSSIYTMLHRKDEFALLVVVRQSFLSSSIFTFQVVYLTFLG